MADIRRRCRPPRDGRDTKRARRRVRPNHQRLASHHGGLPQGRGRQDASGLIEFASGPFPVDLSLTARDRRGSGRVAGFVFRPARARFRAAGSHCPRLAAMPSRSSATTASTAFSVEDTMPGMKVIRSRGKPRILPTHAETLTSLIARRPKVAGRSGRPFSLCIRPEHGTRRVKSAADLWGRTRNLVVVRLRSLKTGT